VRRFAQVVALACALGSTAFGQTSNSAVPAADECESDAAIVAHGHLAKKDFRALLRLSVCTAIGGNAVASGFASYAHDTNVSAVDEYTYLMNAWRDSAVFQTAISLAIDTSASHVARVFAVRYLISLIKPNQAYTYAGLTTGDAVTLGRDGAEATKTGCAAQARTEKGDLVSTPLPRDFESRVRATLAAITNATSTPRVVRNAAHCAN
jgi:hypothetical protein